MTAIENHMEAARSFGPVASESFTLRVRKGGKMSCRNMCRQGTMFRLIHLPRRASMHSRPSMHSSTSQHSSGQAALTAATRGPQRPP